MPVDTIGFTTAGGLQLEGRLSIPDDARGAAILCHPHPGYGGSMSSGMIPNLQRALWAVGWASLRFNFRGVGRSEGSYGSGVGEVHDARAALDHVARSVPGVALAVAGWSFGSIVGLAVAVADDRVGTYAAIAPPTMIRTPMELPALPPGELLAAWTGRAFVVCGTEDPFCTPTSVERWAKAIPGAEVRIVDGQDHFFSTGRDEVARAVAEFIAS